MIAFLRAIRAEWPLVDQSERNFVKVQMCIIAVLATLCAALVLLP